MVTRILLGLVVALSTLPAHAGDREGQFQNLDRMIEELNLRPYFKGNLRPERKLKIAVFDNGFKGAREQIGRDLPAGTRIHGGPVELTEPEESHGFYMAKILWSLLSLGGKDDRYAPAEFHLYRTFGYSNLEAAVNAAIRRRVDIVLYSQTWEYGGNFDGHGFINKLVSKAVNSGILWINNAGNFGDSTYNAPVKTGKDDWVELPGLNSSVEVRCADKAAGNTTDKCPFRAVLSWNDFADDVEKGTDKDLDFVITDDTLGIVQSSSLAQKKDAVDQPGSSKYPREILTAELKPGLYFLRVKNRSKNFTNRDRLRITVSGDFLAVKNFDRRESLLPPADNAGVITVGALDSEKSSLSEKLQKPEIYTNSLVSISREENFKGTSNSAAMVAAGAAILFSLDSSLSKSGFLKMAAREAPAPSETGPGRGLPLRQLGFSATTREGCFRRVSPANAPDFVKNAVRRGGTIVSTNAGRKIFYPTDPIRFLTGIYRRAENDILVVTERGPTIFPRSELWQLPRNVIEILQTPRGAQICNTIQAAPIPRWGKIFRLPARR